MDPAKDPLVMIFETIALDPRDWSQDEPSATIFAIICGWQQFLPEVAARFHWSEEKIVRLDRLRSEFVKLCPEAADD